MPKPTTSPTLNTGNALGALVGHCWLCYEGSGSTVNDLGAAPVNGTFAGSLAWTTDANGDPCLDTPTNGSKATLASAVTMTGDWSIAFRAKQTTSGTDGIVFGDNATTNHFAFFNGGSGLSFKMNSIQVTWSAVSDLTVERNYVISHNDTAQTFALYSNGSLVSSESSSTTDFRIDTLCAGFSSDTLGLIGKFSYLYTFPNTILDSTQAASLHSDPYQVVQGSGGGGSAAMAAPFRRGRRNSTLLRM